VERAVRQFGRIPAARHLRLPVTDERRVASIADTTNPDHFMSPLKLLSVNVGMPRDVDWQGRLVRTSIFKSAVLGPVRVTTLNLEGDEQSDLTVHGGVHKGAYAYPSEHYVF
jgi:hypothetical protein